MEKFYPLQGFVCAKTVTFLSFRTFNKDIIKLYTAAIAFCLFFFSGQVTAQIPVTVTGGANTTPALLANYPSLSAALVDVNAITAMTGAVALTLSAGAAETTPPSGLTIGSATLNPVLSSTNSITILKAAGPATTLNAGIGVSTPASAAPDGILKIVGADYITIDGLTLTDGNVTNPATMEFGIALFKLSTSDGAQNNIIQNCIINMQRINSVAGSGPMVEGAVNILVINSTPTAATTALVPVSAAGSNSNNKFYSNSLNNGHYGIAFSGYSAPSPYTVGDTGNDIGGTSSTTGNTILNYGGGGTTACAGIRANFQWGANISFNTVNNNDGSGVNHAGILRGIYGQAGIDATVDITNNTVTVNSGATTSLLIGIENFIGNAGVSNTVTVSNNTVQNCTYSTATTGLFTGIDVSLTAIRVYVEGNTVTNNTLGTSGTGTSGAFIGILAGGIAAGELNVNNNTITSNTKNGSSGTMSCLTIGAGAGIVDGNIISDNTSNLTGTTSATLHGINNATTSGASLTISNNSVFNLTHSGSNTGTAHNLNGISSTLGSAAAKIIINNTINNLQFVNTSTGSVTITGINHTTAASVNINNNKIYDLTASNGAASVVLGITHGTTTVTANIYNNLIGNLTNSAANLADAIKGINITNATALATNTVAYNTIFINATSSGALFGTTGIFHTTNATATTGTLVLRNNIIVNTSTPNSTGITAAYRRSSTTLTNYSNNSNHNLFYSGTPGPNRVILYDGTNGYQTLADYKVWVATRDANSVTENPPFLSTVGANANFLHISPIIATQIESGASNVTGITDDYDGDVRQGNGGYGGSGTAPDIGADEGDFTSADLSAPIITYTPLLFTCATGDRALNGVTIADASGVPTAGALQPRVYYKKGIMGTWFSLQGTLASGTSNNGTWNFTIVAADMGGITSGDVIYYYVIAQDLNGTPNVGANPGTGLVATSVNSVTTHPTTPNNYSISNTLSGTYNVGTGQTYTTLTAAINAYNTSCLSGPVVFQLMDASYSIGELVVNANADASLTNTLTIRPNAGLAVSISGTSGAAVSALIKLNGADYIIFDGLNTGGATLTIENTSVTSGTAVFWLSSLGAGAGARNNAIKNLTMKSGVAPNSATTVTYGIVFGGATLSATPTSISAGDDNDNNLVSGNTIIKFRYGMYVRGGSSTNLNTGTIISNNTFGPSAFGADAIGKTAMVIREEDGIQITGNNIGFIGGDFANTTAGTDRIAIAFGTDANWTPTVAFVKNATVTNNKIHDIVDERTFSAIGVMIGADGTTSSNNLVANNMFYNLKSNGTSTDKTIGIATSSGNGDKIVFNSIYLTGDTDPNASAGVPSESNYGIQIFSATNVTNPLVRNNIVYMDLTSSSAPALKNACIDVPASFTWGTGSSDYNDLYIVPANTQSNIGSIGSTAGTFYNTIALWRTASSQDLMSINSAPTFTSSTDLHLVPASNGAINDFGIPVAGVPTDYDGDTRDGTSPDMGMDEFSPPAGVDMGATALVTPVANACYTNAETVTVSITNFAISNIDFTVNNVTVTASTTGPVVYSSNVLLSSGTLASGAQMSVIMPASIDMSLNGTYVFTVSATVSGDINVGNDATVHNRVVLKLGGTYTVGGGGNYTTLTAAIADYNNANCFTGPVVFSLTDATYTTPNEVLPISVNPNSFAGTNTLTIKPAMGVTTNITGSSSTSILKLNGADYVIIDGSNGTNSKDLTISNTSTATSTAAIWIASTGTGTGATNNTIKNTIVKAGSNTVTSTFGIYAGGTSISTTGTGNDNDNLTIHNNTISKAYYGVYAQAASTGVNNNLSITNNAIGSTVSTDYIGFRGLLISQASGALINLNTVFNLINGTSNLRAMEFGAGFVTGTISNNTISEINYTGTTNSAGKGITLASGISTANITVVNNTISALKGHGSTTASNNSWAIMMTDGGGYNIYYNSINIPDNRTTTTSIDVHGGIYIASGVTALSIKNNSISITGNPGHASGKMIGIYSLASSPFTVSNYNDLYVSGAQHAVGFFSSANQNTLGDWQTATTQDLNSISADPVYNSNTNLAPQIGSPLVNAGSDIPGVATDILGVTRHATMPTIGAYENASDLAGPAITYTPLIFTCTTTDRMLVATIVDPSGVSTAGALQPRIYYKKNAGSYFSSPGTLSSGTGQNGSWTFNIIVSDMGGVVIGDVISYFIIAQDLATTPNIIANPSAGLVATDVNTITTPPTSPNTYAIGGTLSGTYTVGAGGAYTTLTAAIAAYNTSCITGTVVFNLTDAAYGTSETFPIIINANPYVNSVNKLTIKATQTSTLTGSSSSALLVLNGADYVTIDGSIGSTINTLCPVSVSSRDLTIVNTNTGTTSAVIWLQSNGTDGASNNRIMNNNLTGNSSTTTLFGVGSGNSGINTSSAGINNHGNSIVNNNITKTQYGIYSKGASAIDKNVGTVINQNIMNGTSPNNIGRSGIWVGFEDNLEVSGNRIENITNSADLFGITIGLSNAFLNTTTTGSEVTNATVSHNIINNITNTGTNSAAGISVASAASGITHISNNMISGVSANGTVSDLAAGILLGGGAGSATQVYYNTVAMNGTIQGATAGSAQSFALAVTNTTPPVLDFRNNILVNTQLPNTSGTTKFYAIGLAYTSTPGDYMDLTSDKNDLYSTPGTNRYTGVVGNLGSGVNQTALTDWQTTTGRDNGSISMDPVFNSATDLHLNVGDGANSPLETIADPLFVTNDIDCQTRHATNPDIGADEFTIVFCAGAVGGTASGANTFCGSGTPAITGSGYSIGVGSTYQWQSSTDLAFTTPVDISGQTNPAALTTGVVTSTTYYRLKVTCTAGTMTDFSSIVTITVNAIPTISASSNGPICSGTTLNLTGTTNIGTTFSWTGPNGFASTLQNPSIASASPDASGSYNFQTTSSAGCSASSNVMVTVNPTPSTPIVNPISICNGSTGVLTVTNPAGSPPVVGSKIGTGTLTTSVPGPYRRFYGGQRMQMLYTAAELSASGITAGQLTSLAFFVNTVPSGITSLGNVEIKLKNTMSTTVTTSFETGTTSVYTAATYQPIVGANVHIFNGTSFSWDGVSNLLVEFCFNSNDAGEVSTTTEYTVVTGSLTYFEADNNASVCTTTTGTVDTERPNIRFEKAGATVTYTWNPGNLTGISVNVSPTSTTQYTVTGESSTLCASSANVTVTVNTLEVSNTNNSGGNSLREVIGCAVSGSTVTFAPALSGQTINLASEISIGKDLTLAGLGKNNLTVAGGSGFRIFNLLSPFDFRIEDMTLINANPATNGGAIWVQGDLILDEVRLDNNKENGVPKSMTLIGPGPTVEFIGNVELND